MKIIAASPMKIDGKLDNSLLIEFIDGTSALFPASFLYAHMPWYQLDVPLVNNTLSKCDVQAQRGSSEYVSSSA